jgi:hypothetical protein
MKISLLAGVVLLAGCNTVQTKIDINAPAKDVRSVLLKFEDYPKWNPFIVKVDGPATVGAKVQITVKPVGKDPISGETTITALTDSRLAWTGSLAVPGLFSGNHEFIIEDDGPEKTVFYQNEKMSGLIVLFFDFKPEEQGFVLMNEALKKQAEAPAK